MKLNTTYSKAILVLDFTEEVRDNVYHREKRQILYCSKNRDKKHIFTV